MFEPSRSWRSISSLTCRAASGRWTWVLHLLHVGSVCKLDEPFYHNKVLGPFAGPLIIYVNPQSIPALELFLLNPQSIPALELFLLHTKSIPAMEPPVYPSPWTPSLSQRWNPQSIPALESPVYPSPGIPSLSQRWNLQSIPALLYNDLCRRSVAKYCTSVLISVYTFRPRLRRRLCHHQVYIVLIVMGHLTGRMGLEHNVNLTVTGTGSEMRSECVNIPLDFWWRLPCVSKTSCSSPTTDSTMRTEWFRCLPVMVLGNGPVHGDCSVTRIVPELGYIGVYVKKKPCWLLSKINKGRRYSSYRKCVARVSWGHALSVGIQHIASIGLAVNIYFWLI